MIKLCNEGKSALNGKKSFKDNTGNTMLNDWLYSMHVMFRKCYGYMLREQCSGGLGSLSGQSSLLPSRSFRKPAKKWKEWKKPLN